MRKIKFRGRMIESYIENELLVGGYVEIDGEEFPKAASDGEIIKVS